jgi:hypothetical protein
MLRKDALPGGTILEPVEAMKGFSSRARNQWRQGELFDDVKPG